MKKITYMLLAGALLCSCADEKPHFLPAPGGTVEIGGIGATPSSDAAALLDDDLTTYFEAEVGSENSVEAVVDCSAGRIVAYTLVSSGVVEQGDNGVEALYDPVSWKVYGSDDGASWNEVDSRSEVAFIARFQKHIYYLAAPADYAKYKFVFKANGGDKLTLSDILFHTEDPYAAWKNFESPEILFIDLAEDKGSKLYDVLVQDKIAYLKWHALEICTYLYFNDRDERFPVNTIEYFLEPMPGEVSYKGGSSPKINIHYSTDWIQKSANESLLKLSLETRGVLFHELVHAYQFEPKGIGSYSTNREFWACIEGLADAVRAEAGLFDIAALRKPGGHWPDGYKTTGFFLQWLTTMNPDALREFHVTVRDMDVWSFDKAMRAMFGPEKGIEQMWAEYQQFLQSQAPQA
mgnify:FL=1